MDRIEQHRQALATHFPIDGHEVTELDEHQKSHPISQDNLECSMVLTCLGILVTFSLS